jgi:hypothetical protein
MPESRTLYASVVRLIVQLTILAIINWLLTELPMIRSISIPGLPVTISALISLVIGIIMIVILLTFRNDFVPKLRTLSPGFHDFSAMVSDAVSLAIIVVAYTSFDDIIKPFMKEYSWAYSPVFLAIAIWPLAALISSLYHISGPISDWLSGKISRSITVGGRSSTRCAACGKSPAPGASFCTECGASMTLPAADGVKCSSCGARNAGVHRYCFRCGAYIEQDEQYDTRVSI